MYPFSYYTFGIHLDLFQHLIIVIQVHGNLKTLMPGYSERRLWNSLKLVMLFMSRISTPLFLYLASPLCGQFIP
jgi:hypothetical protein